MGGLDPGGTLTMPSCSDEPGYMDYVKEGKNEATISYEIQKSMKWTRERRYIG
jgi:hypothetical protein